MQNVSRLEYTFLKSSEALSTNEVKLIHSKTMCVVGNTFVNQLDIH